MKAAQSSIVLLSVFLASLAPAEESGLKWILPNIQTGSSNAVRLSECATIYTGQIIGDARNAPAQQVESLLHELKSLLDEVDRVPAFPVRLEWVVRSDAIAASITSAMASEFTRPTKPAVTIAIGRLPKEGAAAALNAIYALPAGIAVKQPGVRSMSRANVAMQPAGGTVYVSGQSEQGKSTRESAQLTLGSLMRTLDFLKLKKSDVMQFKIFLQPIAEAGQVVEALQEIYFSHDEIPPVVFVEWLGKPSLEIEMVATSPARPEAPVIEYLTPPGMTTPTVYCRVARVNSSARIYLSSITSERDGDGTAQTKDVFAQLGRLLEKSGSDFEHLAKATYFVTDDATSKALGELRPQYYDPKRPPAASKAVVSSTGIGGRTLALDMIAVPK